MFAYQFQMTSRLFDSVQLLPGRRRVAERNFNACSTTQPQISFYDVKTRTRISCDLNKYECPCRRLHRVVKKVKSDFIIVCALITIISICIER